MELLYSQPQPIGGNIPFYNGNISTMRWINNRSTDAYAYDFTYDGANRLSDALFAKRSSGGYFVHDNSFDEKNITYDANGNILTLNRYAANQQKIDQLNYNYLSNGNQISYITDAMGDVSGVVDYSGNTSTSQSYFYDLNGNMTSDVDKNITAIGYNYLNKPEQIDFGSNNKIQYIYDATGVKLAKKVIAGNAILDGSLRYLGNFVYDRNGVLQYILTSEGRLVPTGNTYRYEYFMKDHLGNTRVTYAAAAPGLPQVMEYQHYYPFGMQLEALGYTSGADLKNNYLYNGKELQEDYGLNWYDYGARMYDPVIGRWSTVDPLTEKNRRWSPYRYGYDNPIRFLDPDGMFEDWYRNDETGSVVWSPSTANFITLSNGDQYRNIGTTYSTYSSGTRYDYTQNEITNIYDASPRFNLEGGQYIPKTITTDDGTKVNVTFNYKSSTGGSGDKAISRNAVSLLITGINEANNTGAGVKSIDVSTTTTGKHSSDKSAHYVTNGARAFDIDVVNGVSVSNSKSHNKVDAIQQGMKQSPNLNENYGPNIQEKNGNAHPVSGHDNHIHESIKPEDL